MCYVCLLCDRARLPPACGLEELSAGRLLTLDKVLDACIGNQHATSREAMVDWLLLREGTMPVLRLVSPHSLALHCSGQIEDR